MRFLVADTLAALMIAAVCSSTGVAKVVYVEEDSLVQSAGGGESKPQRGTLTVEQARQYMLELINKDRALHGLKPVSADERAMTAGQSHAEEMATKGYLGHYDVLGRKPWQRYTEAGGTGFVSENTFNMRSSEQPPASQNGDKYTLIVNPHLQKDDLEQAESSFMNEVPPNDGHKTNILNPVHDGVGIGIAVGTHEEDFTIALTQEFTENKGRFSELPHAIESGKPFTVSGELQPGYKLHGIDIKWDSFPRAMSLEEIGKMSSYALPEKKIDTYWPAPYISASPIAVTRSPAGDKFSVTITPGASWMPGIYYIEIWAANENSRVPIPISMRTVPMHDARKAIDE